MGKSLMKLLKHFVFLLSVSALAGTLLLVLVFCIPTAVIQKHVVCSIEERLPEKGKIYDNRIESYLYTQSESYTDSIMVQYAFEKIPGKNAFEHAMWAYHYDLEEAIWAAEDSLRAVAYGADTSQMHLREYSRYWHGYLIYLKPLLLVFSWTQLIWLEAGFQLVLMAGVAVASWKRKCLGVAIVTAAGFLFMKPILIMASLTMSVCWILTLTALLVMLLRWDWLEKKNYVPEFFLCIGILTAYFDFLTYPLVTLGLPLCAYFLMWGEERIRSSALRLFGYCVCWGVGYAGMWASKWVLADVTLRTGTIRDALWNVLGRSEAIGGHGMAARVNGGFHVIGLNLQQYGMGIYAVSAGVLGVMLLALGVMALRRKISLIALLETAFPYLVILLLPFVWIVGIQHHSALHARFTFRIIGVSVTALCSAIVAFFDKMKTAKSGKNGK